MHAIKIRQPDGEGIVLKPRMTQPQFFDIGANLTDPQFQGCYREKTLHVPDLQAVLQRAREHGVTKLIITAGSAQELRKALDLCDCYDPHGGFLYTTVGVHPTNCNELAFNSDAYLEDLVSLAQSRSDRIIAIGEFGLDYDRTHFCTIEAQKRGFKNQLRLLVPALRLPLFLHMRAAAAPFREILSRSQHYDSTLKGVVHSFTGSLEDAESLLTMGLDIGVNGCSLRTIENLNVVRQLPVDRLHCETDAPWCDIRPTHASWKHVTTSLGKLKKPEKWEEGHAVKGRNEPCCIRQVAEVVACLHQCTQKEQMLHFWSQIYQNSLRLFSRV